jgi:hypothetical protein
MMRSAAFPFAPKHAPPAAELRSLGPQKSCSASPNGDEFKHSYVAWATDVAMPKRENESLQCFSVRLITVLVT